MLICSVSTCSLVFGIDQLTAILVADGQGVQKLVERKVSIAKVEFNLLQDLILDVSLVTAVLVLNFAHEGLNAVLEWSVFSKKTLALGAWKKNLASHM
jgi:hypothetical protein